MKKGEKPASRRTEIGKARRSRMRARLLTAAARVIARHGKDNATIDDFIRAADVARGTFYNHFQTREDILEALWTSIGHDPFLEIQQSCSNVADPAERLATVTRLVLQRALEDPTWGWLVLALSADEKTVNDDLRTYPRPDLDAGKNAGRFRFDHIACAADLVVGAVRSGLKARLSEDRDPAYAQSLCRMILLALGINRIEAHRLSSLPLPQLQDRLNPARPARRRAR